jgi:hypothetical protein
MKRLLATIAICAALAGCQGLQLIQQAAGTAVTPTQALVAANAFDAAESGATGYLIYCKTNLANAACSADNRRAVIKYTRAGRAARNQIETYIQTSASIPTVLYNTLVAAVTNLKSTPAANYTGAN